MHANLFIVFMMTGWVFNYDSPLWHCFLGKHSSFFGGCLDPLRGCSSLPRTPEANLPSIYKQGLCAGGTGDVRVTTPALPSAFFPLPFSFFSPLLFFVHFFGHLHNFFSKWKLGFLCSGFFPKSFLSQSDTLLCLCAFVEVFSEFHFFVCGCSLLRLINFCRDRFFSVTPLKASLRNIIGFIPFLCQ